MTTENQAGVSGEPEAAWATVSARSPDRTGRTR